MALPKKATSLSTPGTIGFRLDPAANRELATRAERLGLSSHQLARDYVIQMLQASEQGTNLKNANDSVHAHLCELREDLSLAIETLLIAAGNVEKTEARAWIAANFPCFRSPTH